MSLPLHAQGASPWSTSPENESPAKSQNSQITASGDRRTANDFK